MVHQCLVGIFHSARMMEVLRKCSVIPPQDIVGVLILKAGRLKEQRSEECQAARKHATQLCAECIVNMVGLKVRMAATSASALTLQPNLVSVQLWNQGSLELASRNAAMTMIATETRSVALMGVVMYALPQNTKLSQVIAQQLKPIMLVSAKVSAVQIGIAEEIRSVVEMAAVVSVVHLLSKLVHVVHL